MSVFEFSTSIHCCFRLKEKQQNLVAKSVDTCHRKRIETFLRTKCLRHWRHKTSKETKLNDELDKSWAKEDWHDTRNIWRLYNPNKAICQFPYSIQLCQHPCVRLHWSPLFFPVQVQLLIIIIHQLIQTKAVMEKGKSKIKIIKIAGLRD